MQTGRDFAICEAIPQDGALNDRAPVRAIFDNFILDGGRRELSRRGLPLHVSPKALQLLELVLRAAPDAVSKAQAYQHLWGSVFVEETNIANLISELRNALGDDSRKPRLIRTLHRFGYRFDGTVAWEDGEKDATPVAGRSWLLWASREFPLSAGENTIGRDSDAKVVIDSAAISRRHARVTIGERAVIEDLGSKNGTFVRDERITGVVEIYDGDTIGFGSVRVLFRFVRDVSPTVTDMLPPA